jgi:NAD(P)-dependent dehydrogenase (short-subunit alcohol dehydrogenase family)
MTSIARKVALVYGGHGQLGRQVIKTFTESGTWQCINADLFANSDATSNAIVSGANAADDLTAVLSAVGDSPLDLVICVAGGWRGGAIADAGVFEATATMLSQNLTSALVASHVAATKLRAGGTLILTGAKAALSATPGMVAYGVAKAATHSLVRSIAAPGGIEPSIGVFAILPAMLDTATNRAAMPDASFDDWTKLPVLSQKIFEWVAAPLDQRPRRGALVEIVTKNNVTTYVEH